MKNFGKVAFASLKVFRKDLEENLTEFIEDLGLKKECEDEKSVEEEIELKREKVLKKVNSYFDKLKEEVNCEPCGKSDSSDSVNKELLLTVKELKHQISKLQEDVEQIKSK